MNSPARQTNILEDPASRADEIARQPKMVSRVLGDTQKSRIAIDYAFLVERERWLEDEEGRLKRKYEELRKGIREERAVIREEQARLFAGLRYGIIEEPLLEGESIAVEAPESPQA